jgi:cysteinylglycine-S-conjugate dipeptidase
MNQRQAALQYFEKNHPQNIENLKDLIKIPSVSFEGFDPISVENSAEKVVSLMNEAGLENVEIIRLDGTHPYVYGDFCHKSSAPTVLLYAHHDVQPPMREELWESPPFSPEIRNNRLYGRGSADDKAGIIIHLASIAAWIKSNSSLPINVKVIIEGEEEIGSEHLGEFLKRFSEKLKADVMVLADLANYDTGTPTITTSLRGMLVYEVEMKAMEHALHSGLWSGPIPDPAMGLNKLLASLTDDQGMIQVPGLLDDLIPLSELELESLRSLDMSQSTLQHQASILNGVTLPEKGEEILKRLWRLPSLVVNSMEVAQRKSAGNVLMDKAWARFGVRLAPGMDAMKCHELTLAYLHEKTPWGLELKVTSEPPVQPWYCNPSHAVFESASQAMSLGYGKETVFIGCGASIPFVKPMSEALGQIPAILIGVEDPYCKAHGENESLHLGDFKKAIRSQIIFFDKLAQCPF